VSEYTGGVDGTPPSTSSCFQLAYVSAYSGGSIPFVVIGGQYVHGGTTLINPNLLKNFTGSGDLAVKNSVLNETGPAWGVIQDQAWWIMAMLAKASGSSVASLATAVTPHWSTATQNSVNSDLAQL